MSRPHNEAIAFCLLLLAGLPTPVVAQHNVSARAEADVREIERYRLTSATLTKLSQVQENMYAALRANPALGAEHPGRAREDDASTLDEMVKHIDRVPEMRGAIVSAGLTPREYLVATMALAQAALTMAVSELPVAKKSPIAPAVQANVAFVKAHKGELDRMEARAAEIEALSKPGSAGEPADAARRDTTAATRP